MADIKFSDFDENSITELIELLFFAYRDFINDPDVILREYGFGRAHHRVIHFVARNPGIAVAQLLEMLQITKQSLARVLKELVQSSFVIQKQGTEDRRQRLLYLTDEGQALFKRLRAPQSCRIRRALEGLPPKERPAAKRFLQLMLNDSQSFKTP